MVSEWNEEAVYVSDDMTDEMWDLHLLLLLHEIQWTFYIFSRYKCIE
jgi:hypothetical protein